MDRWEAYPLLEKEPKTEGSGGGGLPVFVCTSKLQHGICKLKKSQKICFERSKTYELESSKGGSN